MHYQRFVTAFHSAERCCDVKIYSHRPYSVDTEGENTSNPVHNPQDNRRIRRSFRKAPDTMDEQLKPPRQQE
jgi:hypothetical protein